jgi:hypothetical protein
VVGRAEGGPSCAAPSHRPANSPHKRVEVGEGHTWPTHGAGNEAGMRADAARRPSLALALALALAIAITSSRALAIANARAGASNASGNVSSDADAGAMVRGVADEGHAAVGERPGPAALALALAARARARASTRACTVLVCVRAVRRRCAAEEAEECAAEAVAARTMRLREAHAGGPARVRRVVRKVLTRAPRERARARQARREVAAHGTEADREGRRGRLPQQRGNLRTRREVAREERGERGAE